MSIVYLSVNYISSQCLAGAYYLYFQNKNQVSPKVIKFDTVKDITIIIQEMYCQHSQFDETYKGISAFGASRLGLLLWRY